MTTVTIYPKEFGSGKHYTIDTVPSPRGTFEIESIGSDGVIRFKDKLPATIEPGDLLVLND